MDKPWYDWWAMRNLLARLGHSGHVQGGADHASPQQRVGFLDPRLQPIGVFAPKDWVPTERRRRLDVALGRTPPAPAAAPAGAPPAFPPASR